MPSFAATAIGRRLAILLVLLVAAVAAPSLANASVDNAKQQCVYSAHEISILDQFDRLVGQQVNCAMVFNDATSTWAQWAHPWFINYTNEPNYNWSQWATAPGTSRRLIITQNLFPSSLVGTDWLQRGAAGDFTQYATQLAQSLVAAGLGNSVIRLSPEANGTWKQDSLGTTPAQWHLWDEFWSKTVLAMRAVPGAHFAFDWCVSALWRALPLNEIYPGNKVVDIIGVDAYDTGNLGSTDAARWAHVDTAPFGLEAIRNFARAQGKPLSVPEWGVSLKSMSDGFGDDPTFVAGIAKFVQDNNVAYQSYFFKYGYAIQLHAGTRSLAAYKSGFGARAQVTRAKQASARAVSATVARTSSARTAVATISTSGTPVPHAARRS